MGLRRRQERDAGVEGKGFIAAASVDKKSRVASNDCAGGELVGNNSFHMVCLDMFFEAPKDFSSLEESYL